MMKVKNNAGFSLVEVVVAMAILASVIIPVCTGMMVAPKVNAKAEAMLRAKIAVSSAVETLMAEGIDPDDLATYENRFEGVTIELTDKDTYYNVEVSDNYGLVTVVTSIRAIAQEEGGSSE